MSGAQRRHAERDRLLASILESVEGLDASPLNLSSTPEQASFIAKWNETWPARCSSIRDLSVVGERVRRMPKRLETTFESIKDATCNQEEAVE